MTTTSYLNPHLTQEWNDWLNTNIIVKTELYQAIFNTILKRIKLA